MNKLSKSAVALLLTLVCLLNIVGIALGQGQERKVREFEIPLADQSIKVFHPQAVYAEATAADDPNQLSKVVESGELTTNDSGKLLSEVSGILKKYATGANENEFAGLLEAIMLRVRPVTALASDSPIPNKRYVGKAGYGYDVYSVGGTFLVIFHCYTRKGNQDLVDTYAYQGIVVVKDKDGNVIGTKGDNLQQRLYPMYFRQTTRNNVDYFQPKTVISKQSEEYVKRLMMGVSLGDNPNLIGQEYSDPDGIGCVFPGGGLNIVFAGISDPNSTK